MSERHRIQDATGVVDEVPALGATRVVMNTTPTNGKAGYAKSCIWQNTSGSLGTLVYVNTGSVTSTTWTNIL